MGPEGHPCTLEEIGRYYKRSRQAIHDVFKSRGYKLRSKPIKPCVIIDNRKFTPRDDGYWRATAGDRRQLHVYIWEKKYGKLPAGHGIHHKDLDRGNNSIENLECLPITEISSKHNPHLNQFTSPNGSRKWKWGRIIPRQDEKPTPKNLRQTNRGGRILPGDLLRGMQPDPAYRHLESLNRRNHRGGDHAIVSPPGTKARPGRSRNGDNDGMRRMSFEDQGGREGNDQTIRWHEEDDQGYFTSW